MNPYRVVIDFEEKVSAYTGAPHVVAVNSCTMALFLALKWCQLSPALISIPRRTYVSVPQQIIHAGFRVAFRDEEWHGEYQLEPLPVWDSARRFTSGMYRQGAFQCVSFHASKTLGIEQGGAILHSDPVADKWLRRARFDGRTEGVPPGLDTFTEGWHCYMSPSVAAQGLLKMYSLPLHNPDLPNDDYPDLSQAGIFQ